MRSYNKHILSIHEQIEELKSAKRVVESEKEATEFLSAVEYYRFRGYSFQFYDNSKKEYKKGTKFSDIVSIYNFDAELSHLLFSILSAIEISLRSRFVNALLTYKKDDALILYDPAIFEDKRKYWTNISTISNEIAHSSDVFIKHNFDKHEGNIPVWAAAEIMSFGTLSKRIKNLKTDPDLPFSKIAESYTYSAKSGNQVKPSKNRLVSWIRSCVVLRNICAHNGRIYNRALNTTPEILEADRLFPAPKYNGVYQTILAIKYLRPSDEVWHDFAHKLTNLVSRYSSIDIKRLNFPDDWKNHFAI